MQQDGLLLFRPQGNLASHATRIECHMRSNVHAMNQLSLTILFYLLHL